MSPRLEMGRPAIRVIVLTLILSWFSSFPILGSSAESQDPAGRLQEAQAAMESGNYQKAISLYREMIEDLPNLPGLHMHLGIAYYLTADYRRAADHLQRVIPEVERHETLAPTLLFLGASQSELGDHEKAVKVLTAYSQKRPKDPQSRTLLGEALLSMGRYQEAAEQFEILAGLQPEMPQAWYALGKCYEALAAESFERLEATAPESAYWFALVGHARLSGQQYESAFVLYKKALEKDPKIRGLHAALSTIYQATGHLDWARIEREREVALGTLDCESESLVCDFTAGRWREILERTHGRDSPEALYWRAQASIRLADEALDRLAQLRPSFELHRLKAEIQEKQDRPLEAVREWEKALELAADNPVALRVAKRGLALASYHNRDFSRAKFLIDELLEIDPHSSELNYYAGRALLEGGEFEESVPFLQKALGGDGFFPAANAALGRAYLSLGKTDQALPHLESALETDEDGSVHSLLAQVYQRRGERERAKEIVEAYREIQRRQQMRLKELDERLQITPP